MSSQTALIPLDEPKNLLIEAVRSHVGALRDAGVLTGAHEVYATGAIECARRVGGRFPPYSFAGGLGELREWLALLPAIPEAGDPIDELVEQLKRVEGHHEISEVGQ